MINRDGNLIDEGIIKGFTRMFRAVSRCLS